MPTDYGSDVSTFPDLDETFAALSGSSVVAEAIARRLSTPRGSLAFHADYGLDLRVWLNEAVNGAGLDYLRNAIRAEVTKDERVAGVTKVDVAFSAASGSMSVALGLLLSGGPFRLTLSVTALSVDILSQD